MVPISDYEPTRCNFPKHQIGENGAGGLYPKVLSLIRKHLKCKIVSKKCPIRFLILSVWTASK
jgi:hypothetical protein